MSRNLIDWLSISLPYNTIFQIDGSGAFLIERVQNNSRTNALTDWLSSFDDWSLGQGRKVFSRSAFSAKAGITIFWKPELPYSLVEITGHGCSELRKEKLIGTFIHRYGNWLTRIDISRDIACDTDPRDFAKLRDVKRFTSYEEKKEGSGISYYVGSRLSERFACVYRYAEGHPRHGLMRVEHRLKGDYAKSAAAELTKCKLSDYVNKLGNVFGWRHEVWDGDDDGGKPAPVIRDSGKGKTEVWLFKSVLPALRKLKMNGGLETLEYFAEQLYALINE